MDGGILSFTKWATVQNTSYIDREGWRYGLRYTIHSTYSTAIRITRRLLSEGYIQTWSPKHDTSQYYAYMGRQRTTTKIHKYI